MANKKKKEQSNKQVNLKELLEQCSKCEDKLTVQTFTELIQASFSLLYTEGTILKEVEKQIGEEKFDVFITSLLGTILTNVYANSKHDPNA